MSLKNLDLLTGKTVEKAEYTDSCVYVYFTDGTRIEIYNESGGMANMLYDIENGIFYGKY